MTCELYKWVACASLLTPAGSWSFAIAVGTAGLQLALMRILAPILPHGKKEKVYAATEAAAHMFCETLGQTSPY